jgi:hypothetical protein
MLKAPKVPSWLVLGAFINSSTLLVANVDAAAAQKK